MGVSDYGTLASKKLYKCEIRDKKYNLLISRYRFDISHDSIWALVVDQSFSSFISGGRDKQVIHTGILIFLKPINLLMCA